MTLFEQAVADAKTDRGHEKPPTIDELQSLIAHKDQCNENGNAEAFIDAQADLINALLVALASKG